MNIFIGWSGKTSEKVAQALHDWLPKVIQSLKPFISHDISSGTSWFHKIAKELKKSDFGIVCLTPDNLDSIWLYFEAGALAAALDEFQVCAYLYSVEHSNVQQPLSQFQNKKANKNNTFELINDINKKLSENNLTEKVLFDTFEKWWPELEKKLEDINIDESKIIPDRDSSDKINEILKLVRSLNSNLDFIKPKVIYPGGPPALLHDLKAQGSNVEWFTFPTKENFSQARQLLPKDDQGILVDTINKEIYLIDTTLQETMEFKAKLKMKRIKFDHYSNEMISEHFKLFDIGN